MPTRVRSFCKVNLGLAVGPPRADGFHGLVTLYQTLGLHDDVSVSARLLPAGEPSRITLGCTRDGVPARGVPQSATGDAERNTAWRMVAGALERLGLRAEVHIEITKRLPVQGGLGAGSANAAAALLALERELGLGMAGVPALDGSARLGLAAEVGSDVPLFLLGGSVMGTGRGEQVFPLPDVAGEGVGLPVVVAVPGVGVSTRLAFAALDRRLVAVHTEVYRIAQDDGGGARDGRLTSRPPVDKLEQLSRTLCAAYMAGSSGVRPSGITPAAGFGSGRNESSTGHPDPESASGDLAETPVYQQIDLLGGESPLLALVRTGIRNDFEDVAFEQHPSLRDLKQALVGEGNDCAVYAALSGSGSALFGIYPTAAAAERAQQRVQRAGAAALLTETLPRQAYWEQMFVD